MQRQLRLWGIDLGSHALKVVSYSPSTVPQGAAAEDPGGLGAQFSVTQVPPADALAVAVRSLCRRSGLPFRRARAVVALPAAAVVAHPVYLPPLSGPELRSALSLEMERLLFFSADEWVGDYLPMVPRRGEGEREEQGYLLVAAHHPGVQSLARGLRLAGLRPVAVEPEPAALYRLALLLGETVPDPDDRPRILVDLGAAGTRLVVVWGEQLLLYRDIPVGGRHLTAALAEHQGIGLQEAEEVKRTGAWQGGGAEVFGRALQRLRSELERSLRYVERQRKLQGYAALHLVGGGARGPLLRTLVERVVGIPAREMGYPFASLGPEMAKAVALALWHRPGHPGDGPGGRPGPERGREPCSG